MIDWTFVGRTVFLLGLLLYRRRHRLDYLARRLRGF